MLGKLFSVGVCIIAYHQYIIAGAPVSWDVYGLTCKVRLFIDSLEPLHSRSDTRGGSRGGPGGSGPLPPSLFGEPPNFIKREKTSHVCARKRHILVLNSYPDPLLSGILYPPLDTLYYYTNLLQLFSRLILSTFRSTHLFWIEGYFSRLLQECAIISFACGGTPFHGIQ